jgi:hypothetical protein
MISGGGSRFGDKTLRPFCPRIGKLDLFNIESRRSGILSNEEILRPFEPRITRMARISIRSLSVSSVISVGKTALGKLDLFTTGLGHSRTLVTVYWMLDVVFSTNDCRDASLFAPTRPARRVTSPRHP